MDSWSKLIKKHWVTLWLIIVVILLAILTVSASYAGNMEAKRVVSTRSVTDVVFSSNVMVAPDGIKSLYSDQTSEHYVYPITVCNFAQMTPTIHAKEQIDYKLNATLMKYNEDGSCTNVESTPIGASGPLTFSIQKIGDDNNALTNEPINSLSDCYTYIYESESLDRTVSCTDTFLLTFDKSMMKTEKPQYCIYLRAIPKDTTAISGSITEIGCYLNVSKGMVYDTGWSGELAENDGKVYDAYNLIVSGSGTGTIEICYNFNRFSINGVFLNDSTNTFLDNNGQKVTGSAAILDADTNEIKKVILQVDSLEKSRYEIQFFKVDSADYKTSEEVAQYIFSQNYVKGNSANAANE